MSDETLRSIAAIANASTRRAAVTALAARVGAEAVYVFVPHPDVPTKPIPAPGFPATMPSSRGWRELLARCATPGCHQGVVAYPTAGADRAAVAYAHPGVTLMLVGAAPDPGLDDAIGLMAPLLAAMLRAEADAVAARGELEVARHVAERSSVLARALDLARGEAERATLVKDEFLAMLGHELRNPLAPIVTALQMLRLDGINTRAQDVLERQVAHLMRLVDDLLDVARITRGKIELRRERVEIAPVIVRAIEISRPLLERRRNQLELEVPEHGLVIDGDPARLAQVFSNLVTNAAKYSDAGTRIRVVAERDGGIVRVAVEDQGIGLDPSLLERVFDQFMQLPQGSDRSAGGLGLGLAIVRSLVHIHGGTVRAFSAGPGQGSRFVVELTASEADDDAAATSEQAIQSYEAGATGEQVLVVDDNTDAADLLAEVLSTCGYRVRIAHDGPQALQALATFAPRAAVLDLGLPVMDGYELARNLRARIPGIRLLALTGYGRRDDRERTSAAGFDAHLVKPVSIDDLTHTLDQLLR